MDTPPLPRLFIGRDDQLAERLYKRLLSRWLDSPVTEQTVGMLVDDISSFFEFTTGNQQMALASTLSRYYGQQVTKDLLIGLAYQLAANRAALSDGKAVLEFRGVSKPEWVPFLVRTIDSCKFGNGAGVQLNLLVIAGVYAGNKAAKKCPVRFLWRLALDIGFNRKLEYDTPNDLLGLMFAGYLVPTAEAELSFEHYAVNTAMKKHNQALIRARKEVDE